MARVDSQIFDSNDGLPKGEFTRARQPNCVRDAQGRLWFAMTKGVALLDPGTLRLNELPPAVHVEEISYHRAGLLVTNMISGRPVVSEEQVRVTAPFGGRVSLPAGSHGIEIHYACLSFAAPEKVKTEVRLEGLESTWRPAEGRVEQFRDLKPGPYVFRVRTTNNDGVWNQTGESVGFGVVPYYWQTTPFRLGVGLLLVGAGALATLGWSRSHIRRASEAERVARELADARQQMHLAAEATQLGLWSWDPSRNRFWATERCRELLGLGAVEELSVGTFLGQVLLEDRKPIREALDSALGKGSSYDVHFRVGGGGEEARWIAMRGRGECDGRGQPKRLDGVCVDITERRRVRLEMQNLRQELAHANRVSMMGQLASSLAHELNQPLGAILRNAEAAEMFLASSNPDLEEVRSIITDIRKDDQRAGGVIDRLRQLLKRREIEMQAFDPAKLADEVLPLLRTDALARRVAMELETTPDLPLVFGDRVQLQQVLLNLILNAMDAVVDCAPDKRRVKLRIIRASNEFIAMAVIDSGHGIPLDKLESIFDPFFTTKPRGLGMGLSISRTIVEAHGGRISATNNAQGGATVSFTLPVANGDGQQVGIRTENAASKGATLEHGAFKQHAVTRPAAVCTDGVCDR
jgi:signal transduction histidine kinase